jgi:hypothetical protein
MNWQTLLNALPVIGGGTLLAIFLWLSNRNGKSSGVAATIDFLKKRAFKQRAILPKSIQPPLEKIPEEEPRAPTELEVVKLRNQLEVLKRREADENDN